MQVAIRGTFTEMLRNVSLMELFGGVCEKKKVLNFFYGKLYKYLILIQNKAKFISIDGSETPVWYSYLRSIPSISILMVKVLGFNSF